MGEFDHCLGCDARETPISEDHAHQYINMRRAVVMGWWLDGIFFSGLDDAISYVRNQLSCDMRTALKFLSDLPRKYN